MVGTSQLNPLALADWAAADKLLDLEGVRLLDALVAAPDEVKATVKAFAAENGKKYTAPAFDADPVYAEQVADILNQQVAA